MRIGERQVWLAIAVWLMMAALEREPAATVAFHELPLAEALDRLFASRPIVWRQTGRYVILRAARRLVTVSGFVRDASSHETLLSASVWDRGRSQGTVTNHYGYYSLLLHWMKYW